MKQKKKAAREQEKQNKPDQFTFFLCAHLFFFLSFFLLFWSLWQWQIQVIVTLVFPNISISISFILNHIPWSHSWISVTFIHRHGHQFDPGSDRVFLSDRVDRVFFQFFPCHRIWQGNIWQGDRVFPLIFSEFTNDFFCFLCCF